MQRTCNNEHTSLTGTDLGLKAKISVLGEWYGCRVLAVVANSGVSTLGFKRQLRLYVFDN